MQFIKSQQALKWPLILAGLVFLIGLLFISWGFKVLYNDSQENLRSEIKLHFETKAEQLQEHIRLGLETLNLITALYQTKKNFSHNDFEVFVRSEAALDPGITALAWVPRVVYGERTEFINQTRDGHSPKFNIFEVSRQDMPGFVYEKEIYFPIHYLVPLRTAERLQEGMNLVNVPSNRDAMKVAMKSKKVAVTRRILLRKGVGKYGFLAFLALPEKGTKGYIDISSVGGFAMGQFDISALLQSIFVNERNLDITLFDVSAKEDEQLLYHYAYEHNLKYLSDVKNISQIKSLTTPYWARYFDVGDRQWLALFRSPDRGANNLVVPYLSVIIGIMLTLVISIYFFLAQLRNYQLVLSQQRMQKEQLLKAKVEQENLSKPKFLRAASHDLRQPLHTLSLYTDLLKTRLVDDRESSSLVDKIKISNQMIQRMLNALLDLERLEAGELKANICNFAIEDLLEKLKLEYEVSAEEKNLQLSITKITGIVTSDPNLLERILRNFISNAIRYTQRGEVTLECIKGVGELHIQVRDTGQGFDQEIEKQIFTKFYQAKLGEETSEQTAEGGLGIGLSIVSHMAKLLGHKFGVSSVKGKGSTFYINVPFENH